MTTEELLRECRDLLDQWTNEGACPSSQSRYCIARIDDHLAAASEPVTVEMRRPLAESERNHLRRLIAYVRCEIGQEPEEMVAMMQPILARLGDVSPEGKARLVEQHRKADAVPKYVRAALKALAKTLDGGEPDAEPVTLAASEPQPVAWVPVHPRNGPLWTMATPSPSTERLPSYPLIPIYASPPAARAALSDDEIWRSDAIMAVNAELGLSMMQILRFARAVEQAHGIGAPEKAE